MMRRLFRTALAALFVLCSAGLWAQSDIQQDLKDLRLTQDQLKAVVDIVRQTQGDLDKARAESRIIQAQIARLLLDDNPSLTEIDKLVHQSADWDVKGKMVRIDRSLKIRQAVGKDGWARLSALSQRVIEAERTGRPMPVVRDEDKGPVRDLIRMLRDLN